MLGCVEMVCAVSSDVRGRCAQYVLRYAGNGVGNGCYYGQYERRSVGEKGVRR